MKVTVLGTGYVGLVSGVCLAAKGHTVTCVDLRAEVVERLNRADSPIHERGLPDLLREVIAAGRFSASLDLAAALGNGDIVLVAVGTPSQDGRIDLSQVETAVRSVGILLRTRDRFLPVVIKSTVVAGTTDGLVRRALQESSGKSADEIGLGMNPEFLREGDAISDFMQPDRIVLGADDDRTAASLAELYAPWDCEKLAVNSRTAELIKYANNALLATQISAVNEIANLAAKLGGIDALEVMRGVHLDKRWSPSGADGSRIRPGILDYLLPGCGFGGSCFPKDLQALRSQGNSHGVPMHLLNAVLEVNADQPSQVLALLQRHFDSLKGRRILLLGLAFKPETDDVRESASRQILAGLLAAGARVTAHDPVAAENARRDWPEMSEVGVVADWRPEIDQADAVIVATRWPEYGELRAAGAAGRLAGRAVVDARRMFSAADFPGAAYLTIGYSPISSRS